MNPAYKLKTSDIYYDKNDQVIQSVISDGVQLDGLSDEQVHLIKTLDRRLLQLWDKVTYERENGYVIYPNSPLWKKIMKWCIQHFDKG